MDIAALRLELQRIDVAVIEQGDEFVADRIALSRKAFGRWWPDNKWCVYYLFRSTRTSRWCFDSESEACENLIRRVARIRTLRSKYGAMTTEDVRAELNRIGVNPKAYDLDGLKFPDGRVVLANEGNGRWLVYSDDRGEKLDSISFDTETGACEYMLDRILMSVERFGGDQWG